MSSGRYENDEDTINTATNSLIYELYAFVVHQGGANPSSGHYITYAATLDHRWHAYDDENVRDISIEYEMSTLNSRSNVYLLCYKRALM